MGKEEDGERDREREEGRGRLRGERTWECEGGSERRAQSAAERRRGVEM